MPASQIGYQTWSAICDDVGPPVVQHHDVEVAAGAEFAAAVAADRDQCDAVGVAEQFAQPGVGSEPFARPLHRSVRSRAESRRRQHFASPLESRGDACSTRRLCVVERWHWTQSALVPRSPVRTRTTVVDRPDPDLAVTDLAGLRRLRR